MPTTRLRIPCFLAPLLAVLSACSREPAPAGRPAGSAAPAQLADTGLYADAAAQRVAADVIPFTPNWALWTDGAAKRRWIRLPPGTAIDASRPDDWEFPAGTRLWKEFAFERRIETRYLERLADGTWLYATYVWNEQGTDAVLAPERGVRGACETGPGTRHDIPAITDCYTCHQSGRNEVLGFSAVQLARLGTTEDAVEASTRQGIDLDRLVARGLVRHLPASALAHPPLHKATPRARDALGYLHANCGACHTSDGPIGEILGLVLELSVEDPGIDPPAVTTAAGRVSRFRPREHGDAPALRIDLEHPERSVLLHRVGTRDKFAQMPPLGTHRVDAAAVELLAAWIREDLAPRRRATTAAIESTTSKGSQ